MCLLYSDRADQGRSKNRVDGGQKSAAAAQLLQKILGILGQWSQTDALVYCQVLMVYEVAVYDVFCCR